MLMQNPSHLQARINELQDIFAERKSQGLQQPFKEKAWSRFLELGFPEKEDAYQYVPLRALYETPLSSLSGAIPPEEILHASIAPECRDSCLVFVNGVFRKELSRLAALPKELVILPLQDAFRSYATFLQGRFAKSLKEESDPFALLNLALSEQGAFLFVPPQLQVEVPIQCLHIVQGQKERLTFIAPRLHVFLGKQASLHLSSSTKSVSQDPFFTTALMDIVLEEGAILHEAQISGPVPEGSWQFHAVRATLKRSSLLNTFSASQGAKSHRSDFRVSLLEENATANLQGISLLQKNSQVHTHVVIDHLAPHTHSLQRFKAALKDISQTSFQGKIRVAKEAQKTEAYQLNNNLILGERAVANSKPGLEICADDVKASHGATIAKLDPAHLFYLTSRGLSERQAKSLLVVGFCKEILSELSIPSLKEELFSSAQSLFGEE